MIHEYISYSFDSNVFVIEDSKNILVDAGTGMTDSLNKFIASFKLDLVINTHCHIDHVGGNPRNIPVAIGEKDAEDLERGTEKTVFDFLFPGFKGFKVSQKLKDGDVIETENYRLEVLHTPGHTNGSICLYDEARRIMFSGDTFFIDGIGRTDLPSGNTEDLKKSLKRLTGLDIEKVYPGHGEAGKCDVESILNFWF